MLESHDPELHRLVKDLGEVRLEMRPDRSFLSATALEALGSELADHYVEGFREARFRAGPSGCDGVESLAEDRTLRLFGGDAALVQPPSHAAALMAVLAGLLREGDTVMAPEAGGGGPLILGHRASAATARYRFVRYGPHPETGFFDHDRLMSLARTCSPALIVVCLHPHPRAQDLDFWRDVARRVKARLVVDLGHAAGLLAARAGKIGANRDFGGVDIMVGAGSGLLRGPATGFVTGDAELVEKVRRAHFPYLGGGGAVHQMSALAVALGEAGSEPFRRYAARCVEAADDLARRLTNLGMTLWCGGTDGAHLVVDTRKQGLSGAEAETRALAESLAGRRVKLPFREGCANRGDGITFSTHALVLKARGAPDLADAAESIYRAIG